MTAGRKAPRLRHRPKVVKPERMVLPKTVEYGSTFQMRVLVTGRPALSSGMQAFFSGVFMVRSLPIPDQPDTGPMKSVLTRFAGREIVGLAGERRKADGRGAPFGIQG